MILAAAFGLAACGGGNQAGNTANIQENVTAQAFESNDITAIDAVTGEDANMAADVDINFTNQMLASSNDSGTKADAPKSRPGGSEPRPRPSTPAPEAEPASNTTADATE